MSGTVSAGQRLTAALLGVPAWTQMTLMNSWSNYAGAPAGQYRWWQLTNELEVIGTLSHASVSGTSQFCSTFTQYLPNSRLRDVGTEVVLSGLPTVQVSYATSGVLEFIELPSGSTIVSFHCFLSLDA